MQSNRLMTCTTCFQITKSFALVAEKVLLVCRFLRSPLTLLWLIFPARLLLLLSSKSLERRTLASPLVDHYCCLASIMVQLKRHVSFYIPYLSCQLSERLIFLYIFFLLFFEITIIISFPSHPPSSFTAVASITAPDLKVDRVQAGGDC